MRKLKVSDNDRYLVHDDNSPFFYLGDTAWELFHRLSFDEAQRYLADRARKRFTVIQAVVLAELNGLVDPNANGDVPLIENDPTRPNERYFAHVDAVVRAANELGLVVGMLPTWGDKWQRAQWGAGPEVFAPDNAAAYGEWLARRYREADLIWILGGDRPVRTDAEAALLRAMARGIERGDGKNHLITLHPGGGQTSAHWFHADDWLSFNMYQSGHSRDRDNFRCVADMYANVPTKPCLDAEPGYEDHPAGFDPKNGYLDAWDCRKSLYWALFAGACGHTYGCHDIWQMYQPGRSPISSARLPWYVAMHLPGAEQMQHGRALVESRPYLSRVPDQTIVMWDTRSGGEHLAATRDAAGTYLCVYAPTGEPFDVAVGKVAASAKIAWWFDPRTGEARRSGDIQGGQIQTFTPPSKGYGQDWVLVIDDAARGYPPPGS
jgi:hypothetical protein